MIINMGSKIKAAEHLKYVYAYTPLYIINIRSI